MCTPRRMFSLALATALAGCGGGLTFPDDRPPAVLQAFSGDGQQGTVGSRLSDPLVARLIDASARPIPGVTVIFQVSDQTPDVEVDPEATTDSDGFASAEVRLGTSTGPLQVEARVATPAALSATFLVTALEQEQGRKDKGGHGEDDDD